MVTTVIRTNTIPEAVRNLNSNGKRNLPPPATLNSMSVQPFDFMEETKTSSKLAAPKNLAPISSKSKATLEPLTLPGINGNNFDSKLSQRPNNESEYETEFESAKTLMPSAGKVDEIGALLGHDHSMAEMQTMNTRSPGPSIRSNLHKKLQSPMEANSMMPAED